MQWNLLEHFWARTRQPLTTTLSTDNDQWDKAIETLNKLGISMEDTVQYLYHHRPDVDTFKDWILQHKKDNIEAEAPLTENVLSEKDLAFWNENGYVIVRNAITAEECEATQQAIWQFLEMDPNDKQTWYQRHPSQKGLMVSFFDHETLNKNRQSARIRKAYEQLYQTTAIYKTIDKVSFNPPETDTFRFLGSPLHWDVSLQMPIPFALQGLLYLTDCNANDGAFHCVPGFHNKITSWLAHLKEDENPREIAPQTLTAQPITANAGDFIIWQNTLPHCATANHGLKPRLVQYLTYLPNDYRGNEVWK